MTDRERLGQLVRDTWVDWARQQPNPKPSWLTGWYDLDPGQREVDMRIGEAVAAAERARIRQLAIQHNAKYIPGCGPDCPHPGRHMITAPFADLLTEGDTT